MNNLIISYVINRLKEPSTYVGLTALLGTYHITISPAESNAITGVAMALGSLLGVFLSESKKS